MCAFEGYSLIGGHDIIHDFQLQDFIDDENFDQLINLIRGENEDAEAQFDIDLITGSCFYNDQLLTPTIDLVSLFGFENNTTNQCDQTPFSTSLTSLPSFGKKSNNNQDHDDDDDEEEDSRGTTMTTRTTTTGTKKPKADRSRITLVSERKRRGRMKDKLYALRALVPNITKMDKASIIGDAVMYVQDLQMQAKKLNGEILSLEASLVLGPNGNQGSTQNPTRNMIVANTSHSQIKQIFQIDVFQVEEKGFHVKVGSNRGAGVAGSIYRAIESLTSFDVQSSNLDIVDSNRFEITLILKVKKSGQVIMNLPNLRFWVAGAFLNQGFELVTDVV